MKATKLEHGKFQASIFKLGQALGEAGAEIITRIDEDEVYRKKVADYMIRGAITQPSSGGLTYRIAKAIMGPDKVIGPDQVIKCFGLSPNEKDVQRIHDMADRVPYLPETLAACSKTHLLVWGIPVFLDEIAIKVKSFGLGWQLTSEEARQAITVSTPTRGWYLIHKGTDQILGSNERLATAMDVYYAFSIHKLTNRTHIFFKNQFGLCKLAPEGEEACFGYIEAFTGKRYQDYDQESNRYWIRDDISTVMKIGVVLPNSPIE